MSDDGGLLVWLLRKPGKSWRTHIDRKGDGYELELADDEGRAWRYQCETMAAALQLRGVIEYALDIERRRNATSTAEALARHDRVLAQKRKSQCGDD